MPEVEPIPKVFKPKKARKRLPPRSLKRLSEQEQRDEVRRITAERAGHRCQGPDAGMRGCCGSPFSDRPVFEVHEPRQRSTHPGSHLDASDTVLLCQFHHDEVDRDRPQAERLGLIVRATS